MRPGWYNRNTGRGARKRHAKKTPPFGEVSSDKERGGEERSELPYLIRWHSTPFIGGGQKPSRLRLRERRGGGRTLKALRPVACGNRDIRNIVSACTVWFTFIFRTPIPRAVEDFIVKVLLASRGACHSASALLPSFTSLLYHKDGDLSRGFLHFF